MPTTHSMPHETHKSNSMRSRRSIDVIHYALDERGKPTICVDNSEVHDNNDNIVEEHFMVDVDGNIIGKYLFIVLWNICGEYLYRIFGRNISKEYLWQIFVCNYYYQYF